ncbi:hypothetical protein NA78x_003953 [Anatilimnocola sp. NA78]|uniref:hypothetical protein n=1 Tax=Anatilimnocola sp. NA78 TaxID=3415683 RepID=UPI003CE4E8A5
MSEKTMEERIATLEQVVATQSNMLLKLVEMLDHLGQESTATNQRLQELSDASAKRLEKIGTMFQSLVTQIGGEPNPESN